MTPFLESASEVSSVVAVDLCGHGDRLHEKPQDEISIADYVHSVVRALDEGDLRDVVLVGHSMAGITIPHVAAERPDRIARLVYLSTTNPPVGATVSDSMNHALSPLARGVDLVAAFCSDLDEESAQWLVEHLGPQPPGVMTEAVTRVAGPPEIPSTYIVLDKDEVLPPAYQIEQAESIGVEEVVHFSAGHSAFASRPEALAKVLLGLG